MCYNPITKPRTFCYGKCGSCAWKDKKKEKTYTEDELINKEAKYVMKYLNETLIHMIKLRNVVWSAHWKYGAR